MWPKGCLDALATGHRACSPCLWAVAILWASRHLTLLGRSRRCPKRCAVVHCNNSIRGHIDTIDFALAHSGSAGYRAAPPNARIIPVQRQNISPAAETQEVGGDSDTSVLFPSMVEKWAEGGLLPRLEDLRCSSEPAVTSSSDFPTGTCGRDVAPKRTFVNSLTQHGSPAEFVPVVQQSAAATHRSLTRRRSVRR